MEQIKRILQDQFGSTGWTITRAQEGLQEAGYHAQHGSREVFVKFTADGAALQRLGELAVAPRLLASGIDRSQTYVIQEYITGRHPDRQWLTTHLPVLASYLQRYHSDPLLTHLLATSTAATYHELIAQDLAQLETLFFAPDSRILRTPELIVAFERLKEQAHELQPGEPIPVHIDPNTHNMLLTDTGFFLVDWDGIQISDPLRDAGLILWWYVPQHCWPTFFQHYNVPLNDASVEKIFWWAARTSLAVVLWCVEHRHDHTGFLQDFLAALAKKDNPHAPPSE